MERREPCLRFRITRTMMSRIEREAQTRQVKTHELARLAVAEGLRVLFGDGDGQAEPLRHVA